MAVAVIVPRMLATVAAASFFLVSVVVAMTVIAITARFLVPVVVAMAVASVIAVTVVHGAARVAARSLGGRRRRSSNFDRSFFGIRHDNSRSL